MLKTMRRGEISGEEIEQQGRKARLDEARSHSAEERKSSTATNEDA